MTKWKIVNINSSLLQSAGAVFVVGGSDGGWWQSDKRWHASAIPWFVYVRWGASERASIKSMRKKQDQNKIKKKNDQIYLFN